jgi:hypothetical protein
LKIALLFILLSIVVCSTSVEAFTANTYDWTNSGYPDLRGSSFQTCKVNVSSGELVFICDPDEILTYTQSKFSPI